MSIKATFQRATFRRSLLYIVGWCEMTLWTASVFGCVLFRGALRNDKKFAGNIHGEKERDFWRRQRHFIFLGQFYGSRVH